MISILMIAIALAVSAFILITGWREHIANTEEIEGINRSTIDELEQCTGKRRFREAYENWENARSLKMRVGNSLRFLLHL